MRRRKEPNALAAMPLALLYAPPWVPGGWPAFRAWMDELVPVMLANDWTIYDLQAERERRSAAVNDA